MISNAEFQAISELDLNAIKTKLMHVPSGEGWSSAMADAVEKEYRRFLYLMKMFPEESTVPSVEVDTFWHYHILDTMKYAADCAQAFGYFLHHNPSVGLEEGDEQARLDGAANMAALYAATFGAEDAESATAAYCSKGQAQGEAGYCSKAKEGAAYCSRSTAAYCSKGAAYCSKASAAYCSKASAAYCSKAKAAYCSRATTAYCSVAKSASAYCSVAKPASAYCSVAKPASAAYCSVAKPASAAYCSVATPASAAYCSVAKPASAAYCSVAKPASAAYCSVAKPASAYCSVAKPTSAYCSVTASSAPLALASRQHDLESSPAM